VAEQFELLRSDDPMFRPVQVVVGPDGAIYVVDWRTNSTGPGWFWGDGKHGRIWRLTWKGTSDAPAIARGPLTTWSKLAELSDVDLIASLDTADGQVRDRAERELMRRQTAQPSDTRRQSLIRTAGDASKSHAARAAALCLAAQTLDRASIELLLATIAQSKTQPELARLAIELLGHNGLPAGEINVVCDRLLAALDTLPPPAARSAAIALGDLVSRLPADDARRRKTAEVLLQYADSHSSGDDPFLVDAVVRGIERMGAPALEILIKPTLRLDLVRSLRAPAAAAALDQALAGELKLSPAQWVSLLSVYRNLQADPPTDITAIGNWLTKHSDMPAEVQLAALESMAVAGKSNGPAVLPVVLSILKSDNAQTRIAALGVVGSYGLLGAAKPLVALLKETERSDDERRAIVAALGKLRPLQGFGVIESTERGVDSCIADLVAIAADPKAGAVRGDVLALVAQLDFGQGQPLAQRMLSDTDASVAVAAINVLGARADQAETTGRQFVAGKIDRRLLPQVAAVLQNHVAADKSGKFATLLAEVFKGGLLVSTDPAELARVEQLVKTTGDPVRGRAVYLSANRSQCVKCHGLEGVGGQIGPDLSKIWQTHTVGKILEAIIEPSKEIKENFQTFVVTTSDGQVHAGLRTSLDDKQVVLRTAEGKDIVIPRGDIDEMAETKRSLMPDGVTAQLSFQEFIDLVAFLKNQAAQESLRTMLTQGWVVAGATGDVEKAAVARIDPLQPLKSADGKPLTWQRVVSDGEGRFDLSAAAAAGAKPLYLLAFVYSPSTQPAQFSIAADGNWQLLVAGKPIERAASAEPTATVAANVPAGWTSLVLKIADPPAKCSAKMSVAGGEQLRLAAEPK
jgi:quinoprotein glucose dehydrogenase